MKPANRDLNEAMHAALGYSLEMWPYWIDIPCDEEKHGRLQRPKEFCTDRNCLPEVWKAIEDAELQWTFRTELMCLLPKTYQEQWACHVSAPRLQIIAALKTLSKWPQDWETA